VDSWTRSLGAAVTRLSSVLGRLYRAADVASLSSLVSVRSAPFRATGLRKSAATSDSAPVALPARKFIGSDIEMGGNSERRFG
jgi:hypothetical protein